MEERDFPEAGLTCKIEEEAMRGVR